MIFSSPPSQFGQFCISMSKTRLSSRAQLMRCGRANTVSTSRSAAAAAPVGGGADAGGPCGTTCDRSFALGASTPWNLIRCNRGRDTNAASRCMNSSGLITRCVVPSRQGILSFSSTCPAALSCTRSSDSAEPGHKQSSGLFVPGEGPGLWPGAASGRARPARRAGDVAAQLLQPLAVVCFDPHRGMQAETIDVGAQGLVRCALARLSQISVDNL